MQDGITGSRCRGIPKILRFWLLERSNPTHSAQPWRQRQYQCLNWQKPLIQAYDQGIKVFKMLLGNGANVSLGENPPIAAAVESFDIMVVE